MGSGGREERNYRKRKKHRLEDATLLSLLLKVLTYTGPSSFLTLF